MTEFNTYTVKKDEVTSKRNNISIEEINIAKGQKIGSNHLTRNESMVSKIVNDKASPLKVCSNHPPPVPPLPTEVFEEVIEVDLTRGKASWEKRETTKTSTIKS